MFILIICVRVFLGKNDLLKISFLIIVIFLDINYIKHAGIQIKYSHKILNELVV